MNVIPVRLHPGQDLKAELDRLMEKKKIDAACILTCVGSLTHAVLRFANQHTVHEMIGYFEIVSLTGVLSRHGSHCHIAVSDKHGSTFGAHLMNGCRVFTTVELIIGTVPGYCFRRTFDPETGFPELDIGDVTQKA